MEGAECPNKATVVLVLPNESQCDLTKVYVHHCGCSRAEPYSLHRTGATLFLSFCTLIVVRFFVVM